MKRITLLWIGALVLGWLFDFLFWRHNLGINFVIYTLLCLGGGFLVLTLNGYKPHWRSLLLLVPLLFFACFSAFRQEPLSRMLATAFTLGLMGLLAVTYIGGRWAGYSLVDYVVKYARLAWSMAARPIITAVERSKARSETPQAAIKGQRVGWKRFWSILRGVAIAVPILVIFTALLSSADLIFAERVRSFVDLFRLERLPEYILRLMLILAGAYALAGSFLHAAAKSGDEKLTGEERPVVKPFLGFIEAAVVLGAVVVLFTLFAAVQFRYFFGGQANIGFQGFTYSEYARRGFGELVAVAVFSLLLFLGMSVIVKRTSLIQRRVFSALGVVMTALVGVMLVSAFQRLLLYETAYGFSRLRIYTHVFMIWLAVLLAAVVVLEILRRERAFALAALVAAMGFTTTLLLMNVDGTIVRKNVARAVQGEGLDVPYLVSLSPDSVPALASEFMNVALPKLTREAAGAVLFCRGQVDPGRGDASWKAFNFSQWNAKKVIENMGSSLADYEVQNQDWPVGILTPGNVYFECYSQGGMAD